MRPLLQAVAVPVLAVAMGSAAAQDHAHGTHGHVPAPVPGEAATRGAPSPCDGAAGGGPAPDVPCPAPPPADAGIAADSAASPSMDMHAPAAHAGHAAVPEALSPHAGHGSAAMDAAARPFAPVPPPTDAMRAGAQGPAHPHPTHDDAVYSLVRFNRLEAFDASPGVGLAWEGMAWIGTDLHKLRLRSEGERVDGRLARADAEVLYQRAIAPWWDLVAGLRHDFKPGPARDYAAVGIVGTAPYKIEVEATAYVGAGGQTAARIQLEYDTLLTNRLILQPLVELDLQGRDDPRRGVGSGLATAQGGLRLRYEVTRRFAPYIGVTSERAFGRTARLRAAAGEPARETRWVAGVHVWF